MAKEAIKIQFSLVSILASLRRIPGNIMEKMEHVYKLRRISLTL